MQYSSFYTTNLPRLLKRMQLYRRYKPLVCGLELRLLFIDVINILCFYTHFTTVACYNASQVVRCKAAFSLTPSTANRYWPSKAVEGLKNLAALDFEMDDGGLR